MQDPLRIAKTQVTRAAKVVQLIVSKKQPLLRHLMHNPNFLDPHRHSLWRYGHQLHRADQADPPPILTSRANVHNTERSAFYR